MGITEYVPAKHIFRVLICAFDDDCAHIARRIHRMCPQSCGLYTYNSTSGSALPNDSLLPIVARQYCFTVFMHTKKEADPYVTIIGTTEGPLLLNLRARVSSAGSSCLYVPYNTHSPDVRILFSEIILEESELLSSIVAQLAAVLVST